MPMLTLQLFHTGRHDHPMLHVVVHGTTVHFYSRELLLSHTNTVQIYRLLMQNKITNISIWNACTLLYKHAHLMVTFTSTRHMLSDVYTPFHNLWYSLAKKMLPITNGETPVYGTLFTFNCINIHKTVMILNFTEYLYTYLISLKSFSYQWNIHTVQPKLNQAFI
jgi:hypothetical protein